MAQILTRKRALEIMAGFPLARVLVIGDIMIDHFIWGKVVRISPEAPVPVVDVKADDLMLGGCETLNKPNPLGGGDGLTKDQKKKEAAKKYDNRPV